MEVKLDSKENQKIFLSATKKVIQQALKNQGLDSYSEQTLQGKREVFLNYQREFKKYADLFKGSKVALEEYLNAYELILKFRTYILGEAGEINYLFIINESSNVHTIKLNSITFSNLLLKKEDNNLKYFELFGDSIKFKSSFLTELKNAIRINRNENKIQIKVNLDNYVLEDEINDLSIVGRSGNFFRRYLQALASGKTRIKRGKITGPNGYGFILKQTRINKKSSRIVTQKSYNNVKSSSIFSAVGKFLRDEYDAKTYYYNNNSYDTNMPPPISPSFPSAGNFTELYIMAKSRLNGNKNKFQQRQGIGGATLLELWQQVKGNSDAFYTGGDYLDDQIKGFLGALPSLTSLTTIRNAVNYFYEALEDINNIEQMKIKLSKLLLQQPSSSKLRTEEERKLSDDLLQEFNSFFQNF